MQMSNLQWFQLDLWSADSTAPSWQPVNYKENIHSIRVARCEWIKWISSIFKASWFIKARYTYPTIDLLNRFSFNFAYRRKSPFGFFSIRWSRFVVPFHKKTATIKTVSSVLLTVRISIEREIIGLYLRYYLMTHIKLEIKKKPQFCLSSNNYTCLSIA